MLTLKHKSYPKKVVHFTPESGVHFHRNIHVAGWSSPAYTPGGAMNTIYSKECSNDLCPLV
jgi:hypothetical protein